MPAFELPAESVIDVGRQLLPVRAARMQVGDVFTRGGSPGHAVLVMDMPLSKRP